MIYREGWLRKDLSPRGLVLEGTDTERVHPQKNLHREGHLRLGCTPRGSVLEENSKVTFFPPRGLVLGFLVVGVISGARSKTKKKREAGPRSLVAPGKQGPADF